VPPYAYTTPVNPYAGSIGELLQRNGDIAASRAERLAAVQARAAEQSGQIWGQATRGIGETISGALRQATDPAVQVQKLQLTEAQRANKSRNVFEAELRNPGNYNPDGTVDDAKITERLKKQDVGAWQQWQSISQATAKNRLDIAEKAAAINKSNAETAEKQQQLAVLRSERIGHVAYAALNEIDNGPGDPLDARDTALAGIARLAADQVIAPDQAKQLTMQLAGADAHQLRQVLGSAIDPTLKAKLDAEAATRRKTTAEAAKAEAEAASIAKFGSATPPAAQSKTFRVTMPGGGTKDVPLSFLPGRTPDQPGRYFLDEAGGRREVFPGKDFVDVPAASLTIHNDKESRAQGTRRELAEQVVDGNLPPSMLSKRADDYNGTLADAGKIYEERTGHKLNIGKLQLDYEAAKKFVSTMNGSQMTATAAWPTASSTRSTRSSSSATRCSRAASRSGTASSAARSGRSTATRPESELANRYVGAINTLKEEFANLANGGFAPTDAAWKLAHDQINEDFGFKDLRASLTEVQRLINYRTHAFGDLKPMEIGDHTAPPPPAAPPIKVGGFSVVVK
jgi:hypothetical protein